MATPNTNDVLSAISSYIENNNRPCPAHFLVTKFGDDVAEVISSLKKDAKVKGLRGRNGGLVFPDTVFKDKVIEASPVSSVSTVQQEVSMNIQDSM